MSTSEGNAVLVNALSSSVRSTLIGIETAPSLIRRVLTEGSWRAFTTPRGEHVEHLTFESFITAPPTNGLGKSVEEIIQIASCDPETLALLADALGQPVEVLHSAEARRTADPVTVDARNFGAFARAGGWAFGLMVARSVQPGKGGGGARAKYVDAIEAAGNSIVSQLKVSAADFAVKAECSDERVMRFFKAWERAAQAGIVQSADTLSPGQQIDLPDPGLWAEYFTSYERSSERRESIAEQAEAAGTSYAEALKVAERPGALRTAILGDAKTAEAARVALADRIQDDEELQGAMARSLAQNPELRRAMTVEARRFEQADYVRRAIENGKVKTAGGQLIELPAQARSDVAKQFAKLEAPESAPEDVSSAYEQVQAIIAEVVEADPEILNREHHSKFRKALSATVKSIDSIDPDDLIAVADDELLESLIAAQERINRLAELFSSTVSNRQ
jgi:hypothetical protein